MSEKKQGQSPGEIDSNSEQDWGDDWESAFQAGEELLSEDKLQADDLDESWDEVLAVSSGTEEPTTNTTSKKEAPATTPAEGSRPEAERNTPGFPNRITRKFLALPLYLRLASSALPVALLFLALIPLFTEKNQDPDILLPAVQPVTEKKSSIPAAPEKTRAKWPLTSFFIPISEEKAPATIFLNLDLTIILLLDEDEDLPSANASRARDLVYQFYTNRPLYELRRFALARGEMNKKLMSWIRKQWPEVNLETIVFDHYELI